MIYSRPSSARSIHKFQYPQKPTKEWRGNAAPVAF